MNKWTELRTAYKLAKLGTLSATAQDLGIHRSTVMRHIDALEAELGIILFQRNEKGYIATEAGLEIMRLGEVTDQHFTQLPSRLKSQQDTMQGVLTITAVSEIAELILPVIKQYLAQYPNMRINILAELRNFNLEYDEADIAIRAGNKPTTPDNIVMPLFSTDTVFCAHKSYIEKYGTPTPHNYTQHRFIALNQRHKHLSWNEWVYDNIPEQNISFTASNPHSIKSAILSGLGIGILPQNYITSDKDLLALSFTDETWQVAAWVLIHRDMFKAPKIQKFLNILQNMPGII